MKPIKRYLAEEVGIDHADGLISRRDALKRLSMLGLGAAAATSLLAACARDGEDGAIGSPAVASPTARADSVETEAITFDGPRGELQGAWAAAENPKGGVLVIHENRGLTDHIRDVAGRFAASGYSALAIDLFSEEGGTAELSGDELMGALDKAIDQEGRFVGDMKGGVDEIERRLPDAKLAAVGFCFGGGMVWQLLDAGEPRLAAAVPFYGPIEDPDFSGSEAAVLGIYAEMDDRVNASRDAARAALEEAELTHEIVTFPGVDHAFFNDTNPVVPEGRCSPEQATAAYSQVIAWFEEHLA